MINIITNNKAVTLLLCVICSLILTGFVRGDDLTSGEPKEVPIQPPDPLPAIFDAVRAGVWTYGINWPWDNYGTDFGSNLWGYRGLANQGPSGWRREIRKPDHQAKRLFWAQRQDQDHCMGVEVELNGPDSSAIVFFRVDELAEKGKEDTTITLIGQTVTVELYLPAGIEGPGDAPSGASLFFQDEDWTWAQTDWMNITPAITNRWITITANLDNLAQQYPQFNQTRVRAIGIKIGTNSQAGEFSYNENFYVDNVKTSEAPEIQFEFNSPDTRTEAEMKDAARLNVQVLRWWLFADGRAGLKYDKDGFVTGLDDKFMNDFNEWIRLARSSELYLMPVLFDFLIGGEALIVDGVQTYGRADLISDSTKRQSLLENAVSPIFDILAEANEVVIIDLFNEPEWLLSDIDLPEEKRPSEIRDGGIIELSTMKTFFSEIIELYKQKGLEEKQLLTIGSASPQWVTLWEDLDLDIAQFHLWNGPGQIDEGVRFDFPPPITGVPTFLGEFSTLPELSLQNTCEILENACRHGYSGAFPWAYRAKDDASLPLLGEESQNCIGNVPPFVANAIDDTLLLEIGESFIVNLDTVFSDCDRDQLSFSTSSSDEAVATTTVSGAMLTVTAIDSGEAKVTITATDDRADTDSTMFIVKGLPPNSVEPTHDVLPRDFALYQNYPNPFNPTTTIQFDLPKAMHVTVTIYNLMGQEVATLVFGNYPAGRFATTWDATGFTSGVYMYQLQAGRYRETRKLLLVK